MKTLEERIKNFRNKRLREGFARSLIKQLPGSLAMPVSSQTALEDMLFKLSWGKLEKPVAILEADYVVKVKPHKLKLAKGNVSSRYAIGVLGMHKLEYLHEDRNDVLDVHVKMRRSKLSLTYSIDGRTESKHYFYRDYFYYPNLSSRMFSSSNGIIIKETEDNGRLVFGGRPHGFGCENSNTYAIVFFNHGEASVFDLHGKVIVPALSSDEAVERIRLAKAYGLEGRMDNFDPENHLECLMSAKRREWAKHPKKFIDIGRSYIIEGSIDRVANRKGCVDIILYDSRHKILSLNAGAKYNSSKVSLRFRGNYVAMYSPDNELINAHRFNSYLRFNVLSGDVSRIKILSVKTISIKGGVRTTAGPFNYCVSKMPVINRYGNFGDFKYVGVMAYIDPTDIDRSTFELLMLKKDGTFIHEGTFATSSRVYRKNG